MKYRHAFRVPEPSTRVWRFFEQPLAVARCLPGVEAVEPLEGEDESFSVRATQKLGPMSTTLRAKVRITERVAGARIAFTATGKAVRGAVGNFRSQNVVTLAPEGGETCVTVEGEVALAGVLGTVGSTVINKHAAKVTAEFASNLERALSAADEPHAGPRPEETALERQ
ncbi:MAG: SRPBCC domain-containing protein [Rhodospirillaceae bacterium]|nr:SRPBCC domain-containing protein [Rhodospirillaceae bacterium]